MRNYTMSGVRLGVEVVADLHSYTDSMVVAPRLLLIVSNNQRPYGGGDDECENKASNEKMINLHNVCIYMYKYIFGIFGLLKGQ